jgi:SAM-dependent methyltransferase
MTAAADALARFYDLDLAADDPGDLDLYLALAGQTDGPILELAVGSGRLAVPLAAGGHDVVGVDLDPAMLERARAAAGHAGVSAHLELVEADLLTLHHPRAGDFGLAILALNSIFLLPGRADQERALRVMGDHLAPGGLAVVDIWLPQPADLARYDGRLLLDRQATDPATGRVLIKTWAATYEPTVQGVVLTTIYEEGAPGEAPVRWVRRDAMRLLGADELAAMARAAGLVVEGLAGDHDLSPLGPGSDRAILLARRP